MTGQHQKSDWRLLAFGGVTYLMSVIASFALGLPGDHGRFEDLFVAVVSPLFMSFLLISLASFIYGWGERTSRLRFLYRGLWRLCRIRQRWPSRLGVLLLLASGATVVLVIARQL